MFKTRIGEHPNTPSQIHSDVDAHAHLMLRPRHNLVCALVDLVCAISIWSTRVQMYIRRHGGGASECDQQGLGG